ncbi:MAG: hypothetical protein RJA99_2344 [Pseudomonadota bacterium]|jgi:hypothetical protein
MHALDAGQLNRLLRDLELTAPIAIRRAAPQVEQYLWLLTRLKDADVANDADYQQRLARYVGLRGKLRARKQALFDVMQALKSLESPQFEDVLLRVSELTGQIEKSVASSLLALFDPEQPSIDRDLRELLPRYGFPVLAEAPLFDECVAWHRRLGALFRQVVDAPRWAAISARIDAGLPPASGAVLTETRKLNVHLSHSRRVVALMPTLEPVPASPRRLPAVVSVAESVVPRAMGRLHLCR